VRREDRLVLPAQQDRGLAGQPPEHDVGSVDDMPLTLDVASLGAKCAHSRKPSRVSPESWPAPEAASLSSTESAAPAAAHLPAGRGRAGAPRPPAAGRPASGRPAGPPAGADTGGEQSVFMPGYRSQRSSDAPAHHVAEPDAGPIWPVPSSDWLGKGPIRGYPP